MDFQTQLANAQALLAEMKAVEARIGPNMRAALTGPGAGGGATVINGTPFSRYDVATPAPLLPDEGYTMGINDRVVSVTGVAANTQSIQNIAFDLDSAVYAWTGAAYLTTLAAAFPGNGFANPLDTFTIQFRLSQGKRYYQTTPTLGSTVLGTAERPRYLGMPSLRLSSGTVLQAIVTPLIANLRIDVTLYTIELTPFSGNVG